MKKHTQDKWQIVNRNSGGIRISTNIDDPVNSNTICTIAGSANDEETMANAQIIESAPDLLKVCEELSKALHHANGVIEKSNKKNLYPMGRAAQSEFTRVTQILKDRGFQRVPGDKYGNAYKILEGELIAVPIMRDHNIGDSDQEYSVSVDAFTNSELIDFHKDMACLFGEAKYELVSTI